MMSRTAEIKLTVDLDAEWIPTCIRWQASDAQHQGPADCEAVMLSVWDSETRTTAAVDLWTPKMTVDDMNLHVYQIIHKLADTYQRSTKNREIADLIHQFGDGLGKRLGLPDIGSGEGDP